MSRNPANPMPQGPPCDSGQFNDETSYYDAQFSQAGWTAGSGGRYLGGDPGHYRSNRACGDFVDAKSYGYELPEEQDRGQYKGQNAETILIDPSRANRGNES